MEDELVQIRNCGWLHEAQFIVSVLAAEGIEALIPDAYSLGTRPELATALGGVRVLVRASELDRARDALAAVITELPDSEGAADEPETRQKTGHPSRTIGTILGAMRGWMKRGKATGPAAISARAERLLPGSGVVVRWLLYIGVALLFAWILFGPVLGATEELRPQVPAG